jgi:arsenate reductase
LEIIRKSGVEPTIIEYLECGWTRPQLLALFAAANVTLRQALRVSKSPAEALGLTDLAVGDAAILDAMCVHPVLVNRPIVATSLGVRLCRPSEIVLDILDPLPPGPLEKEDGTVLITADGKRVA